ncbi:MAG: hypothetical protein J6Q13_02475 [Clostridia bacterium]|nr:hypothetical protein [Clostridia bacterium]
MLVGVVVKNNNNEYLFLKKRVGNQIDLGLIGDNVDENNIMESVKKMLVAQVGYDFSDKINVEPLIKGEDKDGKCIILFAQTNLVNKKVNSDTEFLWCSYTKIKRLIKENRINLDQYKCIRTAEELVVKKSNNAMKVSHIEERYQKKMERFSYEDYVERYTDKRVFLRLVRKHAVKPCGKECWDKGKLIANQFNNHKSFKNFPELMDDEEFVLSIAKTSINPAECEIYFYDYVNPYLRARDDFKLKFLKAVYLNKNVYKLKDINTIVEYCGFQKENKMILADLEFRRILEQRLKHLDEQMQLEYHCSGEDEKELRKYKIKANELKVLCDNMKKGLTQILNSFTVGEEVKVDFEPTNFYEYQCSLFFGKNKNNNLNF